MTPAGESNESESRARPEYLLFGTSRHRYLCEYVFNKSLAMDPRKTVFIHVPEFTKFSVHEITEALELTVRCLLEVVSIPEKSSPDSENALE